MVEAGVPAAAIEVSSHALALDRVEGCRFDVAVFTNLTRDHLDFHGDMESYFGAKRRLFALRKPGAAAVVNVDDAFGRRLASRSRAAASLTFSASGEAADVRVADVRCDLSGTSLRSRARRWALPIASPLLGRFNVDNLLGAAARPGSRCGCRPSGSRRRCAARHARCRAGSSGSRPASPTRSSSTTRTRRTRSKRLLSAVRELTDKKIILVFGCGGDRDRGKRVSDGRRSPGAWPTSRSRPPTIRAPRIRRRSCAEVERGLAASGATKYLKIADRREAIRTAIELANPGVVVVIAGKGHETTQVIGDRALPFDDRHVAAELARR